MEKEATHNNMIKTFFLIIVRSLHPSKSYLILATTSLLLTDRVLSKLAHTTQWYDIIDLNVV